MSGYKRLQSNNSIYSMLHCGIRIFFTLWLYAGANVHIGRFPTLRMVPYFSSIWILQYFWCNREIRQPHNVKKVLQQIEQLNKRSSLVLFRIPLKTYILLALLTLGTMGFSNASLGYLNYPTQVIFKSCKLIPVLAGSILIQGKRYGPLDFTAAVLMCIGLTLFTLGLYGLIYVCNS